MSLHARLRYYALNRTGCGIGLGCKDKKHFVVLMIKFAERNKIALEALFESAARANHRRARRIESRVQHHTALGIGEPQNALHRQVKTQQNLYGRENIEEYFHAC